jgi:tRNA(Ile2) C34 agmatinyltransferase TiaS
VVTAVVGTAVRYVVHRRDRRRKHSHRGVTPRPLCARCGYSAHGLPDHRCPKCGADLRLSGVEHAPGDRSPG